MDDTDGVVSTAGFSPVGDTGLFTFLGMPVCVLPIDDLNSALYWL